MFSESKLDKKKDGKENSVNPELLLSERALASKGSTVVEEKVEKEESNSVLPKLRPRKKK